MRVIAVLVAACALGGCVGNVHTTSDKAGWKAPMMAPLNHVSCRMGCKT